MTANQLDISTSPRRTLLSMKRAVIGIALLLAVAASAAGQSVSRHYFNQNYNFCIDYPSQWQHNVPFDGNAVALVPPGQNLSYPYPEIIVGGRVNQPSEQDESRGQTLEEIFASELAAIKEYGSFSEIKVIEKRWSGLAGYPALVSDFEYMKDKQHWHEHQVFILTRSEAVFSISSTYHPNQTQQFMPVFQNIVRSFRIRCNPNLTERP